MLRKPVSSFRSSKPQKVRRKTWTPEQSSAVQKVQEEYPRFGKDKLAVMLGREGVVLSVSMVGRILTDLRNRRLLIEPRTGRALYKHSRHKRPHAVRQPKEYEAKEPGDLVQIDNRQVRPLPGMVRYQFDAVDVATRYAAV